MPQGCSPDLPGTEHLDVIRRGLPGLQLIREAHVRNPGASSPRPVSHAQGQYLRSLPLSAAHRGPLVDATEAPSMGYQSSTLQGLLPSCVVPGECTVGLSYIPGPDPEPGLPPVDSSSPLRHLATPCHVLQTQALHPSVSVGFSASLTADGHSLDCGVDLPVAVAGQKGNGAAAILTVESEVPAVASLP
ncbi:hypothetical protein NDU88_011467 [Pleurodeles waltl]|uniref:Uncharacterized protein n=1 Tax=Pleurodeles waltl TaxID=8319 RepID=A0AAV7QXB8_PLEWA|nr:hypothetical protein NDU88_011467 [Pleurodeles waltl]